MSDCGEDVGGIPNLDVHVFDLEIVCDRELLPSILVQSFLNYILTVADDVKEQAPVTTADSRILHIFRPRIMGNADTLEHLLFYYESANNYAKPAGMVLRVTLKVSPE
jgi:hypothetical protein